MTRHGEALQWKCRNGNAVVEMQRKRCSGNAAMETPQWECRSGNTAMGTSVYHKGKKLPVGMQWCILPEVFLCDC